MMNRPYGASPIQRQRELDAFEEQRQAYNTAMRDFQEPSALPVERFASGGDVGGNTAKALELMYRSSTGGAPTAEFDRLGGYAAVKAAAEAAGYAATPAFIQSYEISNNIPESAYTKLNKQFIGPEGAARQAQMESDLNSQNAVLAAQARANLAAQSAAADQQAAAEAAQRAAAAQDQGQQAPTQEQLTQMMRDSNNLRLKEAATAQNQGQLPLTAAIAKDLMVRSMTTGAPTAEFNRYGGYDAVKSAYLAAGGQFDLNNVPKEDLTKLAQTVAQTGVGNLNILKQTGVPLSAVGYQNMLKNGIDPATAASYMKQFGAVTTAPATTAPATNYTGSNLTGLQPVAPSSDLTSIPVRFNKARPPRTGTLDQTYLSPNYTSLGVGAIGDASSLAPKIPFLPGPLFGKTPLRGGAATRPSSYFASAPGTTTGLAPGTMALGPVDLPLAGGMNTLQALGAAPNLSPGMLGGLQNAGYRTDRLGNRIYAPGAKLLLAKGGDVDLKALLAQNAETLSDDEPEDVINTDPLGTAQKMMSDLYSVNQTNPNVSPTRKAIKQTKSAPAKSGSAKMEYESLIKGDLGAMGSSPPALRDTDSAQAQMRELARVYQLKAQAARERGRGFSADTFGAPTLQQPTLTKSGLTKKRFKEGGEAKKPEGDAAEPLQSPEEQPVTEESSASRALGALVEGAKGYLGLDPGISGSDSYRTGQALSNMPGVGAPAAVAGIFIGKGAKGWNNVSNALAKKATKQGAAPEEVWRTTGNFKAPDGQWRQEISDADAQMRESIFQGPANRILSHPELFANYPDLGKIMTSKDPYTTKSVLFSGAAGPDALIRLGTAGGKNENAKGMLHELQHAIQFKEGFGQGGSKDMAFTDPKAFEILKRIRTNVARPISIDEYAKEAWQSSNVTPEIAAMYQKYLDYHKKSLKTMDIEAQKTAGREYYNRLLGEAEARAVEARKSYTMDERLQLIPSRSYRTNGGRDIIPLDQLIVKRSKGSPEEGELSQEEIDAASRPAVGNPSIARQVAKTRASQAARSNDVNTLPDPQTYAFIQGMLGEAPDQIGFSSMHPDYDKIMGRGEQGMVTGGVSMIGPAAKALKALTKAGVKTVKPAASAAAGVAQDLSSGTERMAIAQRNAALPVKQGGLGLPANNTAMDRALAMGFDTEVFHGTSKDFLTFNPDKAVFAAELPEIANLYARYTKGDGQRIMPLRIRGQQLTISDMNNGGKTGQFGYNLAKKLNLPEKEIQKLLIPQVRYPNGELIPDVKNLSTTFSDLGEREIINRLPKYGIDRLKVTDMPDMGGTQTQYMIPAGSENIRSSFAAYDPFRRTAAVAAAMGAAAPDLLAGQEVKRSKGSPEEGETSITDQLIGAGETALTLGSGALSSVVGMPYGLYKGLTSGKYLEGKAPAIAEKEAQAFIERNTYVPRSTKGRENLEELNRLMEQSKLPPILPETAMLRSIPRAAVAAQVERTGMAAEKALDKPVTDVLKRGGKSAEMLKALSAPPSYISRAPGGYFPTSRANEGGILSDLDKAFDPILQRAKLVDDPEKQAALATLFNQKAKDFYTKQAGSIEDPLRKDILAGALKFERSTPMGDAFPQVLLKGAAQGDLESLRLLEKNYDQMIGIRSVVPRRTGIPQVEGVVQSQIMTNIRDNLDKIPDAQLVAYSGRKPGQGPTAVADLATQIRQKVKDNPTLFSIILEPRIAETLFNKSQNSTDVDMARHPSIYGTRATESMVADPSVPAPANYDSPMPPNYFLPDLEMAIEKGQPIQDLASSSVKLLGMTPEKMFDQAQQMSAQDLNRMGFADFLKKAYVGTQKTDAFEAALPKIQKLIRAGKPPPADIMTYGIRDFLPTANNFRWVKVVQPEAVQAIAEGMNNSVARYATSKTYGSLRKGRAALDSGEAEVYALYDKNNVPHVTIEYLTNKEGVPDGMKNTIAQLTGNGPLSVNALPKDYAPQIVDFMNNVRPSSIPTDIKRLLEDTDQKKALNEDVLSSVYFGVPMQALREGDDNLLQQLGAVVDNPPRQPGAADNNAPAVGLLRRLFPGVAPRPRPPRRLPFI